MKIEYSKKFIKKYKKCPVKIQDIFKRRLKILIRNKKNPLLNYHKLNGKLQDVSSINLSGDFRVLFIEYKKNFILYSYWHSQ